MLETAYVDSILWHESVKMNQSPELISLILLHTAGLQPTVSRAFLPYTLPSFDKDGLPEFFHLLTYVMNCSTFHLCLEENERGEGIHLRPTMLSEGFQIQIFFFFFLAVSLHFAHILFTHVLLLPGARVWCHFVSCQILRAFKKRVSLLLWVAFLFSPLVTHSRHGSAGWRWSARLSGAKVLSCDFAPQEHSAMSGGTFGCPTEC